MKSPVKKIPILCLQIYGVPVNKQLDEGEELQLSINGYAGNPTNKDVIWTSSDETIATVDEDGTVTGVGEGTVEIKATSVGVATVCETCFCQLQR